MQWNRSSAIGIARMSCSFCHGDGMRIVRENQAVPCNCVFRAAFRACYNRFRECAAGGGRPGMVSLELCNGRDTRRTYSRKREEFMADFTLLAKRLFAGTIEYDVFRFHFLLGADWKLCAARLKLDRGEFFHSVYRIEQRMGRAVAELQPFPLFPLDEYFGGMSHRPVEATILEKCLRRRRRLRLPLSA